MSWTSNKSRGWRQEMSSLSTPQAAPAPALPPPLAIPHPPAQNNDAMEANDQEMPPQQGQFKFPLLGAMAVLWLRHLIATFAVALQVETHPEYERRKAPVWTPPESTISHSGSTEDQYSSYLTFKMKRSAKKYEKIWFPKEESLRRNNVMMTSENYRALPRLEVGPIKTLVLYTCEIMRNNGESAETYSHPRSSRELKAFLNGRLLAHGNDEDAMAEELAKVYHRSLPTKSKVFMENFRKGGTISVEMLHKMQDRNRRHETGVYLDAKIRRITIGAVEAAEIEQLYAGKACQSFLERWRPYFNALSLFLLMMVGLHFGPGGRNGVNETEIFQLVYCDLNDPAFRDESGNFSKKIKNQHIALFEHLTTFLMRTFSFSLERLTALNERDPGTAIPWGGLNATEPAFDGWVYSSMTSEEYVEASEARTAKLGMDVWTAFFSAIGKTKRDRLTTLRLRNGEKKQALVYIKKIFSEGVSVNCHQINKSKVKGLKSFRGKVHTFILRLSMKNKSLFGAEFGDQLLAKHDLTFEAVVPADAKGHSYNFDIKFVLNDPESQFFEPYTYSTNTRRSDGLSNAEVNALAIEETERLKDVAGGFARTTSMWIRPSVDEDEVPGPYVQVTKKIQRASPKGNVLLERSLNRLSFAARYRNVDIGSVADPELVQLEREAQEAYRKKKVAGGFKNRDANVQAGSVLKASNPKRKSKDLETLTNADKGEGSSTGQREQKKHRDERFGNGFGEDEDEYMED